MKLKVIENKKDKMKLEVLGESHTLLNVLREKAWEKGAQQASYMIEHPYLSVPKIIVIGANPKKVLVTAAQSVFDEAKEFGAEFKRAIKR
ncbi:MAG: DNA-directed RNA polymerase subunit L [Candidatus Aenigmatarchaeota archaeon]